MEWRGRSLYIKPENLLDFLRKRSEAEQAKNIPQEVLQEGVDRLRRLVLNSKKWSDNPYKENIYSLYNFDSEIGWSFRIRRKKDYHDEILLCRPGCRVRRVNEKDEEEDFLILGHALSRFFSRFYQNEEELSKQDLSKENWKKMWRDMKKKFKEWFSESEFVNVKGDREADKFYYPEENCIFVVTYNFDENVEPADRIGAIITTYKKELLPDFKVSEEFRIGPHN